MPQKFRNNFMSKTMLQTSTNISWLGFPLNPNVKISFTRHHVQASDCSNLQPMVHLGGRYFLSTTTAPLHLKSRTITTSPLVVYQVPCNDSFPGMSVGLGSCATSMTLTVPLFTSTSFQYVPWQSAAEDQPIIQLHHQSLHTLKPILLNRTVLKELELTYQTLDGQLDTQLKKANTDIDNIHESTITTTTDILAYTASGLSILNSILVGILFYLWYTPRCKHCNRRMNKKPHIQNIERGGDIGDHDQPDPLENVIAPTATNPPEKV